MVKFKKVLQTIYPTVLSHIIVIGIRFVSLSFSFFRWYTYTYFLIILKCSISFFYTGVQSVIAKRHTLEKQKLEVKPHYPFLENTTTKKMETFDPEVFDYIQMNHESELLTQ